MFRANETFPCLPGLALLPAGSAEERGRVIGLYRCESFTRWKDLFLFDSVFFFKGSIPHPSDFSELFPRWTSCLSCDVGRFLIFHRFRGNIFPPLQLRPLSERGPRALVLSLFLFTTIPKHFFLSLFVPSVCFYADCFCLVSALD